MEAKEKWINDTIESIDNIQHIDANPFIYEKVLQRLNNRTSIAANRQPKVLYRLAACIVIVIGLNVFTMIHFNKSAVSSQDNKSVFANEYFSYIDNI